MAWESRRGPHLFQLFQQILHRRAHDVIEASRNFRRDGTFKLHIIRGGIVLDGDAPCQRDDVDLAGAADSDLKAGHFEEAVGVDSDRGGKRANADIDLDVQLLLQHAATQRGVGSVAAAVLHEAALSALHHLAVHAAHQAAQALSHVRLRPQLVGLHALAGQCTVHPWRCRNKLLPLCGAGLHLKV